VQRWAWILSCSEYAVQLLHNKLVYFIRTVLQHVPDLNAGVQMIEDVILLQCAMTIVVKIHSNLQLTCIIVKIHSNLQLTCIISKSHKAINSCYIPGKHRQPSVPK